MSDAKELLKEAADALRTLQSERNALIEKEDVVKFAFDLTTKMVNTGKLSHANSLTKFAELSQKSKNDLLIIEKALEMSKSSDIFKLGSLSDNDSETSSPEEKFKNFILSEE